MIIFISGCPAPHDEYDLFCEGMFPGYIFNYGDYRSYRGVYPALQIALENLDESEPIPISDLPVGYRFKFGRYPQGSNGEVYPITWRVLRRDEDSLLVISEFGLDTKPYNQDKRHVTWSECTLRGWLNSEFLLKAFTDSERSLIKVSSLGHDADPPTAFRTLMEAFTFRYDRSTEDRVFLLSRNEVRNLFYLLPKFRPTEYAIKNGAEEDGCAWWWLRSRGSSSNDAADVGTGGDIYCYNYVLDTGGCVRPAFRIALQNL
ncbi:MAG: DUF6273 domain-containing protein [bacterium]|nr:DUF6273 domain-containing protein [bacterium]